MKGMVQRTKKQTKPALTARSNNEVVESPLRRLEAVPGNDRLREALALHAIFGLVIGVVPESLHALVVVVEHPRYAAQFVDLALFPAHGLWRVPGLEVFTAARHLLECGGGVSCNKNQKWTVRRKLNHFVFLPRTLVSGYEKMRNNHRRMG